MTRAPAPPVTPAVAAELALHRADLRRGAPAAAEAAALAAELAAGKLLEAELLRPEQGGELAEEILALQRPRFDPQADSYCQLLVAPGRVVLNWGTAAGEGAEAVDLGGSPLLARVIAAAEALAEPLRQPGEEPLLSVVPSLRKRRSFPRFFHRDSHASVDELGREGERPSCYRAVWDLGLENSCEVLNVHFVPRRALLGDDGGVAAELRHLFQQQNLGFRAMTDAEIDAVQPQMREAMLPLPEARLELRPGRAFVWLDDLFFHSTYLRHGRRIEELAERPRSILIVRQFARNAQRDIPWSDAVRRALPGL